jgi:hypothetical protein
MIFGERLDKELRNQTIFQLRRTLLGRSTAAEIRMRRSNSVDVQFVASNVAFVLSVSENR